MYMGGTTQALLLPWSLRLSLKKKEEQTKLAVLPTYVCLALTEGIGISTKSTEATKRISTLIPAHNESISIECTSCIMLGSAVSKHLLHQQYQNSAQPTT